ncbi:MAG TPA: NTP transferase domain-containing protein, partial [Candidatus Limnocylindrales bacterium]|nr:NTP transferase domain-containing protein [Candidatus Limnocylindrales bacterium]
EAIAPGGAGSVRNRAPERGLSSSVRLGLDVLATDGTLDVVVVLPADQPLVRPETIRAAVDAAFADPDRPIGLARHRLDGSPNPVAIRRSGLEAARTSDALIGDRGLGPYLAAHPDLVSEAAVEGANPDVDTPADLLAARWAATVRANRDQVDRVREIPDGVDFYAPVSRLFRDDPNRSGDEVLERIAGYVRQDDVVLDVGAGAGRYALPLARRAREVVALDPSASMLEALAADAAAHGIANVRTVSGRWPLLRTEWLAASVEPDVSLVAHLGYDVEWIGPFVDELEARTSRCCLFVLLDRTPSSAASPFWPVVHGEERIELPAFDDLVALLRARGADPDVTLLERRPRAYPSLDDLRASVERQLWVAPGGERHERFLRELQARAVERDGGWTLPSQPAHVGVVAWSPPPRPRDETDAARAA